MDRRDYFPGWDALVEDDPAPEAALSFDTASLNEPSMNDCREAMRAYGYDDTNTAVDTFMAADTSMRMRYAEAMSAE